MAEFTRTDTIELRPGHVLTSVTRMGRTERTFALGPARYSCSCRELVDADGVAAQAHVTEVRGG